MRANIFCDISTSDYTSIAKSQLILFADGAGALVQWLKLPAWKVGEPLSGIQVSKKHNVSSPLTRNDSLLWGSSVTDN